MTVEILKPPRTAVLKGSGINCDAETKFAFDIAGAPADIVHLNELRSGEVSLDDYQVVAVPGGFSYGDDIASGRVFAVRLVQELSDQLMEHACHHRRPILGICNGFQILVQTGLLPFGEISSLSGVRASLAANRSERFESRWIFLKPEESSCAFPLTEAGPITLPVAHGEGRFTASPEVLGRIEEAGQVVYRYCDVSGSETMEYPDNPNGADHSIAAICDPTGVILGLMPHPERFVSRNQHPNWRRDSGLTPQGLEIIKAVVSYAGQL